MMPFEARRVAVMQAKKLHEHGRCEEQRPCDEVDEPLCAENPTEELTDKGLSTDSLTPDPTLKERRMIRGLTFHISFFTTNYTNYTNFIILQTTDYTDGTDYLGHRDTETQRS